MLPWNLYLYHEKHIIFDVLFDPKTKVKNFEDFDLAKSSFRDNHELVIT